MVARIRERDLRAVSSGKYRNHILGTEVTRSATVGLREDCEDVVGNWEFDNPLYIRQRQVFTPLLEGEYYDDSTGLLTKSFEHLPIDRHDINPESSYLTRYGSILLSQVAQEIVSRTSPSRAESNWIQSIGELHDVPGLWSSWYSLGKDLIGLLTMSPRRLAGAPLRGLASLRNLPVYIRLYGRWALRAAANAHLSWVFALKPMYHDLVGLIAFMDSVDRRFRFLKKLENGGYVRRRVKLDGDHDSQDEVGMILHSLGASITGDRHTFWNLEQWGTCRWSSAFTGSWPDTSIRRVFQNFWINGPKDLSSRNVWGAIRAWWELIPWSWLVEWFADVGSFMGAHNNSVPAHVSNVCLMRKMLSMSVYRNIQKPDWVRVTGNFLEHEVRKYRVPLGPELLYYPPLPLCSMLTSSQWSILGSLAILKGIGPGQRLPRSPRYQTKVSRGQVGFKLRRASVTGL